MRISSSAARESDVPSFKSPHFLAPAIRIDAFKKLLADKIGAGKGVDHLSMFTMPKDFERDDTCAGKSTASRCFTCSITRSSRRRKRRSSGLEENLRADPELKSLFGLVRTVRTQRRLFFPFRRSTRVGARADLTTHGGFDDDPPTLNSVVRRVLDKADADPISRILEHPLGARAARIYWNDQVDWPERVSEPRSRSR